MVRALLLLLNFAPPQRTSWKHSRNFLQRRKLQESIALSVTEVVKWDKLFLGRFDFLRDTYSVLIFRLFSKEPHIAGSTRQKELAVELAKRWKEYGFDRVEQPEYKALLSFPNTTHPTRITIKYKNGTIIHQIKGEEQVRLETEIWLLFTGSVCARLLLTEGGPEVRKERKETADKQKTCADDTRATLASAEFTPG